MKEPDQIAKDTFLTIAASARGGYRDKGSKFLAFAHPVSGEEDIKVIVDALRKKYYDATHICYAWRLGPVGEPYRANDDGEPSGTAGRPILGQLLSRELSDVFVAVVRYFGGTKLGVPGLINAYRMSAEDVLDKCEIVERTVDETIDATYSYLSMNEVMRVVKELQPDVVGQDFDNLCTISLRIRKSRAAMLRDKLGKIEGVTIEELYKK